MKFIFKEMFKNRIFVLFSFINMLLPLFITIISSLRQPTGAENVISIGLIISFSTVFNQFLFMIANSFCFIQEFKVKLTHKYHFNSATVYLTMFLFAFLSFALFTLCSCLYTEFSLVYHNTRKMANFGINYALVTSLCLFFNVSIFYEIIKNWKNKKTRSYIFLFLYLALNLILIPVFYIFINWEVGNSWIGLSVSQLLASILVSVIVFGTYLFKEYDYNDWILNKRSIIDYFKFSMNYITKFLLATVLKTILIIIIAFSLRLDDASTPISLMIAKIIWYNSMYFCGFWGDGLVYSLEYSWLENKFKNNQRHFVIDNRFVIVFSSIIMIGTLIICTLFNFSIQPLSNLYCKNQIDSIYNPLGDNWPYNNVNGVEYIINPNEVFKYFWSPDGVYNFKLPIKQQPYFGLSYSYSAIYMTLYHVLINGLKGFSIQETKSLHQKFNVKAFFSNLMMTIIITSMIAIIGISPKDNIGFISAFPGIDSFTFGTMIAAIFLFCITATRFLPKKQNKKIKIIH